MVRAYIIAPLVLMVSLPLGVYLSRKYYPDKNRNIKPNLDPNHPSNRNRNSEWNWNLKKEPSSTRAVKRLKGFWSLVGRRRGRKVCGRGMGEFVPLLLFASACLLLVGLNKRAGWAAWRERFWLGWLRWNSVMHFLTLNVAERLLGVYDEDEGHGREVQTVQELLQYSFPRFTKACARIYVHFSVMIWL